MGRLDRLVFLSAGFQVESCTNLVERSYQYIDFTYRTMTLKTGEVTALPLTSVTCFGFTIAS